MQFRRLRLAPAHLPYLTCLALLACDPKEESAVPTGSVCPTGSAITYAEHIAPFMTKYCNDCHGSALAGAERQGAPSDHNFDNLEGVLDAAQHIDEAAAAGPDSTNEAMPSSGDKPTREERAQLGEWIACQIAAGEVEDHEHDSAHEQDETHEHADAGVDHHDGDAGVEHGH